MSPSRSLQSGGPIPAFPLTGTSEPAAQRLEQLKTLHPKVIYLSLGRIERLLAALDNPERALAPVIHVAGTNGKGSVLAFLRAILEAAGLSVHVYTSPHLVRFNERIRLSGRLISDDLLCQVLEDCERANGNQPITFFEATTAAAFLAFSRNPADVVLLETGLGGRLDATNVVEKPEVTVITPVSHDHHQFLGDDLIGIAEEKAGILKPGVPAIVARQDPEVMEAILSRAAEIGAPMYAESDDWSIGGLGETMIYQGLSGTLKLNCPSLTGPHQLQNAGAALACLEATSHLQVPDDAIAIGLGNAHWPGRLQLLNTGPLPGILPQGSELWLDGGHNPAAGHALRRALEQMQPERPLYVVIGALETKDIAGFLAPLADLVTQIHAVPVPRESASLAPATIADIARARGLDAHCHDTIEKSLEKISQHSGSQAARVLICGSLYLAGHVLSLNRLENCLD